MLQYWEVNVINYKSFLKLLELDYYPKTDTRTFLTSLLINEQKKLPFETISTILARNKTLFEQGDVDQQVKFYAKYGLSGNCLSTTYLNYSLFNSLGISCKIIKFEPIHYALLVYVDKERYFFDISLMSPLFNLYSIDKNWGTNGKSGNIFWENFEDYSTLMFEHSGFKFKWDGTFSSKNDLLYEWSIFPDKKTFFTQNILITKWINENTSISLNGSNTYRENIDGNITERKIKEKKKLVKILEENFKIEPEMFFLAKNQLILEGIIQ